MLTKVIFFTLIHSLWIGLLIAIISGIILLCSRISSSKIRYNLLSACLGLFAISMVAAGIYEFNAAKLVTSSEGISYTFSNLNTVIPSFIETEKNSLYERIVSGLSEWKSGLLEYAYPFLWIWAIVLCFKVIQLFRSVQYINRMKRSGLMPLQDELILKSASLTNKYNIALPVQLYYSTIAAVPQVIGWLKPIILIPIGLINRLTPEQVEAVIAHELAHIKRRDYVINCLQYLLEIFFFFNPFLLWLSNKIKEEREHCCDDLVMLTNYKKTDYINALIVCSEYASYTPVQSLALIKGKNQLLKRVTRLLTNQNLTFNNMEKLILIFLSVFMISFVSVYGTKIKELPVIEYLNDKLASFQSDTLKPREIEHKIKIEKNTITKDENGQRREDKVLIDTIIYSTENDFDRQPIIIKGEHIIMPSMPSMPPMPPMPPKIQMSNGNTMYTWKDYPEGVREEMKKSQQEYAKSQKEYEKSMREMKKGKIYLREKGKVTERPFEYSEMYVYENGNPIRIKMDNPNINNRINEREIERFGEETARLAEIDANMEERASIMISPHLRVFFDSLNYKVTNYLDLDDKQLEQHKKQLENHNRILERHNEILRQQDDNIRNETFNKKRGNNLVIITKSSSDSKNTQGQAIRTQLILDQIVTAYSLESIELNDKLFMVNGVIQSNKIHKKYKKLFLNKDASSLKARF